MTTGEPCVGTSTVVYLRTPDGRPGVSTSQPSGRCNAVRAWILGTGRPVPPLRSRTVARSARLADDTTRPHRLPQPVVRSNDADIRILSDAQQSWELGANTIGADHQPPRPVGNVHRGGAPRPRQMWIFGKTIPPGQEHFPCQTRRSLRHHGEKPGPTEGTRSSSSRAVLNNVPSGDRYPPAMTPRWTSRPARRTQTSVIGGPAARSTMLLRVSPTRTRQGQVTPVNGHPLTPHIASGSDDPLSGDAHRPTHESLSPATVDTPHGRSIGFPWCRRGLWGAGASR